MYFFKENILKQHLQFPLKESIILILYKLFLDFLYLPAYYDIYEYMYGLSYKFNIFRWIFSLVILIVFLIIIFDNKISKQNMYSVIIRFYMLLCIIPMLSIYTGLESIDILKLFYPVLFFVLLLLMLKYFQYQVRSPQFLLKLPNLKNIDLLVLSLFLAISVFFWANLGFPIVFNFDDAYTQRMISRSISMNTLSRYTFTILGGAGFPYLFARNFAYKKYLFASLCFLGGVLLFFINGMKTWLYLYFFAIAIINICNIDKENLKAIILHTEIMMCLLVIISVVFFKMFNLVDIVGQVGRVIIIPNWIGFKSIDFFQHNEFLFLRESIFRFLFDSPYQGGSDFFINYGANSTITSSRANNGLWGDAYRNFGIFGIIIYPFLISWVFRIVEINLREYPIRFVIYVFFLIIWTSVNASFFTWLLTGGVLIVVFFSKVYRENHKRK